MALSALQAALFRFFANLDTSRRKRHSNSSSSFKTIVERVSLLLLALSYGGLCAYLPTLNDLGVDALGAQDLVLGTPASSTGTCAWISLFLAGLAGFSVSFRTSATAQLDESWNFGDQNLARLLRLLQFLFVPVFSRLLRAAAALAGPLSNDAAGSGFVLELLLFFAASLLFPLARIAAALCVYDSDPRSRAFDAAPYWTGSVLRPAWETAVVCIVVLARSEGARLALLGAAGFAVSAFTIAELPHTSKARSLRVAYPHSYSPVQAANESTAAAGALAAASAAHALAAAGSAELRADPRFSLGFLALASGLCGVAAGLVALRWRGPWRWRGAEADPRSAWAVGLRARALLGPSPTPQAVDRAEAIYKLGVSRFPRSFPLRIAYADFLLAFRDPSHMMIQLRKAAKRVSFFGEGYRVYALNKQRIARIEAALGESSLSFQQELRLAQAPPSPEPPAPPTRPARGRRAGACMRHDLSTALLLRLSAAVGTARQRAALVYRRLLGRFPASRRLLQAYSQFLLHVHVSLSRRSTHLEFSPDLGSEQVDIEKAERVAFEARLPPAALRGLPSRSPRSPQAEQLDDSCYAAPAAGHGAPYSVPAQNAAGAPAASGARGSRRSASLPPTEEAGPPATAASAAGPRPAAAFAVPRPCPSAPGPASYTTDSNDGRSVQHPSSLFSGERAAGVPGSESFNALLKEDVAVFRLMRRVVLLLIAAAVLVWGYRCAVAAAADLCASDLRLAAAASRRGRLAQEATLRARALHAAAALPAAPFDLNATRAGLWAAARELAALHASLHAPASGLGLDAVRGVAGIEARVREHLGPGARPPFLERSRPLFDLGNKFARRAADVAAMPVADLASAPSNPYFRFVVDAGPRAVTEAFGAAVELVVRGAAVRAWREALLLAAAALAACLALAAVRRHLVRPLVAGLEQERRTALSLFLSIPRPEMARLVESLEAALRALEADLRASAPADEADEGDETDAEADPEPPASGGHAQATPPPRRPRRHASRPAPPLAPRPSPPIQTRRRGGAGAPLEEGGGARRSGRCWGAARVAAGGPGALGGGPLDRAAERAGLRVAGAVLALIAAATLAHAAFASLRGARAVATVAAASQRAATAGRLHMLAVELAAFDAASWPAGPEELRLELARALAPWRPPPRARPRAGAQRCPPAAALRPLAEAPPEGPGRARWRSTQPWSRASPASPTRPPPSSPPQARPAPAPRPAPPRRPRHVAGRAGAAGSLGDGRFRTVNEMAPAVGEQLQAAAGAAEGEAGRELRRALAVQGGLFQLFAAAALCCFCFSLLPFLQRLQGEGETTLSLLTMIPFEVLQSNDLLRKFLSRSDSLEAESVDRALEESRQETRMVMESVFVAILVVDSGGSVLSANRAAEATFGYSQSELVGLPVDRILPPQSLPDSGAPHSGLLVGRRYELTGVRKEGQAFAAGVAVTEMRRGERLSYIACVEDISDRKAAEAALRASEERTRSILQAAQDGIVTADARGIVFQANAAAHAMFGYPEGGLLGEPLSRVVPALGAGAPLGEALAAAVGAPRQLPGRRRNGDSFPLELALSAFLSPGAAGRAYTAVLRDVSERLRSEAAIREAARQAQASNDAKRSFLANISHEIRTPLNGIIGMSQLLLETRLEGEQREFAGVIQSCATSLLGIVNDVLDFSKIEAGKLELENIEFSLSSTLEHIMDCISLQVFQKGLDAYCLCDAGVPVNLRGDPQRLSQILLNFLSNSLKFTKRGHIALTVHEERREGDAAVLLFRCSDSGPGIKAEDRQKLFVRFSQVDSSASRRHEGTGLGLAISKELAVLMGGDMGCDSFYGEGSVFWFTARFAVVAPGCALAPLAELGAPAEPACEPSPVPGLEAAVLHPHPHVAALIRAFLASLGIPAAPAPPGPPEDLPRALAALVAQAPPPASRRALVALVDPPADLAPALAADLARACAGPPGAPRLAGILAAPALQDVRPLHRTMAAAAAAAAVLRKPLTSEKLRAALVDAVRLARDAAAPAPRPRPAPPPRDVLIAAADDEEEDAASPGLEPAQLELAPGAHACSPRRGCGPLPAGAFRSPAARAAMESLADASRRDCARGAAAAATAAAAARLGAAPGPAAPTAGGEAGRGGTGRGGVLADSHAAAAPQMPHPSPPSARSARSSSDGTPEEAGRSVGHAAGGYGALSQGSRPASGEGGAGGAGATEGLRIARLMLEKLGIGVAVAENGAQAVRAFLEEGPWDLVLMDCSMPVLDGYAASRQIREREAELGAPRTPIIALTAHASQEDRKKCLEACMDDFLTKPVLKETMRSMIVQWAPRRGPGPEPGPTPPEPAPAHPQRGLGSLGALPAASPSAQAEPPAARPGTPMEIHED
eukprot:tig00001215_g7570.t1